MFKSPASSACSMSCAWASPWVGVWLCPPLYSLSFSRSWAHLTTVFSCLCVHAFCPRTETAQIFSTLAGSNVKGDINPFVGGTHCLQRMPVLNVSDLPMTWPTSTWSLYSPDFYLFCAFRPRTLGTSFILLFSPLAV